MPHDATDPVLGPVHLRRELLDAGMDDRAIRRALRAGELVRVRQGAYVVGDLWRALDPVGRHRVRLRAAARQIPSPVVASHVSAVLEHGGPSWGLPLDRVHLTRLDRRAGRIEAEVVQHRGLLRPGDWEERSGLLVSTPAATVLDLIAVASPEVALCVACDLLHRGLVTPAQLDEQRRVRDRWPGTLRADLVLRLGDAALESVGEVRSYFGFWRQHLPMPQLQVEIADEHGVVFARVDFAWPEWGVWVEFDGAVKYGRLLRRGQSVADVVDAEKRREERIARVTGWRCVRIVWADLDDPAAIAWRIRQMAQHSGTVA